MAPAKIMKATTGRGRGTGLNARIARAIGGRILAGEFAPGSPLPNEAEWGREFNASRTAVREAIKTLGAKGLLVSRPKVGSRVEPREHWNLLDRDVLAWHCAALDKKAFLEMTQEARAIIEPGVAAMAARRRTREQLDRLDRAYQDMAAASSGAAMVAPDVRFHLALLAAANNELLAPFGIIIEQSLSTLFAYTSRRNPKPHLVLKLHKDVLTAVALRKPTSARAAMLRLLADTDSIVGKRG